MNKIRKMFLVIIREVIKRIDAFSPRLYMRLYNRYLRAVGIDLKGTPRFIHPSVYFDGKGYSKIHLGNNTVISKDVMILNHDYSITCGLRSIGEECTHEAYWLKDINIGDNVFIGAKASILPGTEIGDNCIIGTGAVIKGVIPDNSIMIGNPAQIAGKVTEWAIKKKEKGDYLFE